MRDKSVFDVRITTNTILVFIVSIPLVFIFIVLSYKLITTAFVDPDVRESIESYIAVLGILSGPAYMTISRFFDRWNAEQDEEIERLRRDHKTSDDLRRAGLPTLNVDEEE
mgnify:CR=1 FL=1